MTRHDDAPQPAEVLTRIRAAIVDLAERRDLAARAAGAALINQAEVRHALAEQRRVLDAALRSTEKSIALARRVADDVAAASGEGAAAPYRMNVEGLQAQRDVVAAAEEHLAALAVTSREHVQAARAAVTRSREVFDRALHEQLRLLAHWERLERARLLLAARTSRAASDRPVGPR